MSACRGTAPRAKCEASASSLSRRRTKRTARGTRSMAHYKEVDRSPFDLSLPNHHVEKAEISGGANRTHRVRRVLVAAALPAEEAAALLAAAKIERCTSATCRTTPHSKS